MTKKYLCGTDYRWELDCGCPRICDSLKELKEGGVCWEDCGIVEMQLDKDGIEIGHKWIKKPNMNWAKK